MLISNTCVCQDQGDCEGDCWYCCLDDFEFVVAPLLEGNSRFLIQGFPVWNGTRDGEFEAADARTFLDKITPVRAEWRLVYEVENNVLTGTLSHHDASGTITVSPIVT